MDATVFHLKTQALVLLRLKDIDLSNLSDQELLDKYDETYNRFLELERQTSLHEEKTTKRFP